MSQEPQKPEGKPPWGDPSQPLLPMGTRIALYYILTILIFAFGGSLALSLFTAPDELQAILSGTETLDAGLMLGIEAFLAPAVMIATVAFVRLVDRKPLFEIGVLWPPDGRHQAPGQLLLAFVGAVGLLSAWTALASLFMRFERREATVLETPPNDGLSQIALYALGFLAAACLTEWILRGYIFSALREQLSWVHAGGVAAMLFVLPSLVSSEVRPAGLVNGFLLGLLLGALRELTGSLWPGVLFHAAWNTILGSVLSLPVSGISFPRLFEVTVEGSESWTGGDYGPEGSWLMTFLLLVAVVALAGVLSRDELPPEKDDDEEDDEIGFF